MRSVDALSVSFLHLLATIATSVLAQPQQFSWWPQQGNVVSGASWPQLSTNAATNGVLQRQQPASGTSLQGQGRVVATSFPHRIGSLVDVQNAGVRGIVYLWNATTIKIEGFTLGEGPPAPLFWIDEHHLLSGQGVHLKSDKYGWNILGTYSNEDVFLPLTVVDPQHQTVFTYHSFGVWCAKFFVNFAYVTF